MKPTGRTGPVYVKLSPDSSFAEFQPVHFPESKEKIEEFIANGFIVVGAKLEHFSANIKDLKANTIDDWDFVIKADGEEKWLELTEIARLEHIGGNYERAPSSNNPYEFATYIFKKLMGKSKRYSKPADREIWLLIYITAWQFFPSPHTIEIIQYWTCINNHIFDRIYMFKPTKKDDGILWPIYPTPKKHWEEIGFDPDLYKSMEAINIDPESWKPYPQ